MPEFNDELINSVLEWQYKRNVSLNAAIDSTRRLHDLQLLDDEDAVELELDIRQYILDELQGLDEEFKSITYGLEEEVIDRLLKKEENANVSPLENKLRAINMSAFNATYKLLELDKKFNLAYGKVLSVYR